MKRICGVMHPDRERYPDVLCNRWWGGHTIHTGWQPRVGRAPKRVRWLGMPERPKLCPGGRGCLCPGRGPAPLDGEPLGGAGSGS